MNCPKCKEECYRDEVDVGVGTIYGPYGCPYCGWSESPEYDCSEGPCKAQTEDHPDCYVNQYGHLTKLSVLEEFCDRFGVNKQEMLEVFTKKPHE